MKSLTQNSNITGTMRFETKFLTPLNQMNLSGLFKFIILTCIISPFSDLKAIQNADSLKSEKIFPGNYIAIGLADRFAVPRDDRFRIDYFNQGTFVNDTFTFRDKLPSANHLVNFNLSAAMSNRYAGLKLDLGFVPFANRNAHQSISAYGLIAISPKIFISPVLGYTRLRKQKKIGDMTGKNGRISFQGEEFNDISLRVTEVFHSYHYGLGVYFNLSESMFIHLEARYNHIFRNTLKLKVRGYKDNADKSFLESILFADKSANYRSGDKEVLFRDAAGKPATNLFRVNPLFINMSLVFTLGEGGTTY